MFPKSTELEGPAVDFGVQTISVIDGGFATPEQFAKLNREREAIEKRTYADIIRERDENRSTSLAVNTTPYDEAVAERQLSTISPATVSPVVTQYEVKLTEERPLTTKDKFKILFSDKPTNPLVITRRSNGISLSRGTGKKEYEEVVKALRMSFLGENEEADQLLLMRVAIESGDPKILDNYFEALEQKHKDSQLNIGKRLLKPLADRRQCSAVLDDAKRRLKNRNLIIAGTIIAAILVVAAAIVLAVFVPPAGATVLGFLTAIGASIVKGVKEYFSGTLGSTATAAVTAGSVVGVGGILELIFGSKRKSSVEKVLEECNALVAEEEEKEKAGEERIKEIKAKKEEAKRVFAAIEHGDAQDQPLVLDSCMGALIAIRDPRARFQEITLKGSIGEKDTELLRDALEINFTVTELNFTYGEPESDEKTKKTLLDGIAKQVLMNRYLQGKVCDAALVGKLFRDIEGLRKQTVEKIKSNFDLTDLTEFPVPIAAELQDEVRKVTEQNKLLAQISQQSPVTAWLKVFEVDYQRAYKVLKGVDKDDGIYKKLRQELKEQRAKALGNIADSARLNIMLREDIKARYSDLFQINPMARESAGIRALREAFKKELKENHALSTLDFSGSNVDPSIRAEIEFVRQSDLLVKYLKESNLANFMKTYSLVSSERRKEVLETVDKSKLMQLIIDKNFVQGAAFSLGKEITSFALDCGKVLCDLDPQTREMLLIGYFSSSEKTPEEAAENAKLVSVLLEIKDLFTDPAKADIARKIYWALTSEGSLRGKKGQPYYDLKTLKGELQIILGGLADSNPLREELTEALKLSIEPVFGVGAPAEEKLVPDYRAASH